MTDRLDRDLFRRIQDRVAIAGIGHLPFAKDIGRPSADTAVEAIQLALADAGLEAEDVDGMSMLEMEATHEVSIELDEGPRLVGDLVRCRPQEVSFGMSVRVVFKRLTARMTLPVWEPAR